MTVRRHIRTSKLTVAAVALVIGAGMTGVMAQDRGGPGGGPRGPNGPGYDHEHRGGPPDRGRDGFHDGRQDLRPDRMADRRGFPQPRNDWRQGGYVPREYRDRHYVINDYRGYGLRPPPRGYQWVGVGGDYVLAAIATGLIMSIITR